MSDHVSWERLVDYWVEGGDDVDEHLLACDACAAEAAQVARIAGALRSLIPAVVSDQQVDALRARGLVVEVNDFAPETRREVWFAPGVDLLVHRLGGLALRDAERVEVTVLVESTGEVLLDDLYAPFEPSRGEVLIACQRHYASMPPDIVFEVRAVDASGVGAPVRFPIPHRFAPPGTIR